MTDERLKEIEDNYVSDVFDGDMNRALIHIVELVTALRASQAEVKKLREVLECIRDYEDDQFGRAREALAQKDGEK